MRIQPGIVVLLLVTAAPTLGQTVTIGGQKACQQCEIRIADRLALGSPSDSVSPAGVPRVAVGVDGTFYLTSDQLQTAGVLMYSTSGPYLGMLGRAGGGPGELRLAWRVASAANGELYVYDLPVSSIHVFDATHEYRRTLRGIPQPVSNPLIIGDSIIAVRLGSMRPRAVPDHEILLYDARSGVLIEGVGPRSDLRPDQPSTVSQMTHSRDGGIWVVQRGDGTVARWNLNGERLTTLRWSEDWTRYARASGRVSTAGLAHAWEDPRNGLLWVTHIVFQPGYEEPPPVEGGPLPVDYFSPARLNGAMNTLITVIDVARGVAVAHVEIDEYAHEFLRDGRLVVMQETNDGYQYAEILELRLQGLRGDVPAPAR